MAMRTIGSGFGGPRLALTAVCLLTLLSVLPEAIGVLPSLPSGRQADQLRSLRDRGKAFYEEKQYGDAIEAFRAVVERSSDGFQDHLNLALSLYQNGDDMPALEALATAVGLAPEHPGAFYLRGLISKRNGDLPAARAALEKAAMLDPTDPAIRYNLGAALAMLGEADLANSEFEAVVGMGFDLGLQHYVSSLYRHFNQLLRRGEGFRQRAREEMELYRAYQQRLSEAAKSQTALEASRYTVVRVPRGSLAKAQPDNASDLRFVAAAASVETHPTAGWAMADLDLDGRPDIVATGAHGFVALWRDGDYKKLSLETADGVPAVGDFDRDGWPDLYVADSDGDRLYRNALAGFGTVTTQNELDGNGRPVFEPVSTALPAGGNPTTALWVDYDHDGDLDVLITHGLAADQPVADRLLRNQGGGEFSDVTDAAGMTAAANSRGAAWADLDDDNDVDLLVIRDRGETAVYTNVRGGQFEDIAGVLAGKIEATPIAATIEDLDNDGAVDLLLATSDGYRAWRNSGAGTFLQVEIAALAGLIPGNSAVLVAEDFNNDGYLDVVVGNPGDHRLLTNAGGWQFRSRGLELGEGRVVSVADANGDGAIDLLVRSGERLQWRLQEVLVGSWLTLRIDGVKNNLQGIGATIEIKSDGLYQMRPFRATPLHFGIGDRDLVEVIRITWPNGIVQNLLDVEVNRHLVAEELERLEGSCPFLYAWDGTAFNFVNEVLGIAPLGMPLAEGVVHSPDEDEYVPIAGAALAPRDGFFEIRLTEELRETGYVDALRLLAVDHPPDVWVVPDEKFASAALQPDFRLFAVQQRLAPRATDQDGRDWSAELAAADERWAIPFRPDRYDGLATSHHLVFELPAVAAAREASTGDGTVPVMLYLTGWVYWPTSSINLAVDQDPRVAFSPVIVEVGDGHGGWRLAHPDIGLPNGKNSTLVVDLSELIHGDDPRVRISTTQRIYWDAVSYSVGGEFAYGLVPDGSWQQEWGVPKPGLMRLRPSTDQQGTSPGPVQVQVQVLAPSRAELRFRGFSRLRRTMDGYETFDYATVSETAPWEQHPGSYTRYGSVDPLVGSADDRYVILGVGDELAVRFADLLDPPPSGWQRDYLLYLNGWVKDGDPNTLLGQRVEPLPFHGMSGYPYRATESYPLSDANRDYQLRYNQRSARPINQPLQQDDPRFLGVDRQGS